MIEERNTNELREFSSMCVAGILFSCVLTSAALGQTWKPLGLSDQTISSIAIDPSVPGVIYVGSSSDFSLGTTGGIFKSSNGGTTWDTLVRGVTVARLVVDPHRPGTVFGSLFVNSLTLPGIIKTTDGGWTWTESDSGVTLPPDTGPFDMKMIQAHPETLFVGTNGFFGGTLYVTFDGGGHWASTSDTSAIGSGISAIGTSPVDDRVVFVGVNFISKVFASGDMGAHWTYTGLADGIIYGIEFSKTQSKVHVVTSWSKGSPPGYYSSTDGGSTWQNETSGLPDSTHFMSIKTGMIGTDDVVLIGGNKGDFGGVYMKRGISNWERVGTDSFRVLALEMRGSTIYAGGQGVYSFDVVNSVMRREPVRTAVSSLKAYPNPFNGAISIQIDLPEQSDVEVLIYDAVGRLVTRLIPGNLAGGRHIVQWDATHCASGTYICSMHARGQTTSARFALVR